MIDDATSQHADAYTNGHPWQSEVSDQGRKLTRNEQGNSRKKNAGHCEKLTHVTQIIRDRKETKQRNDNETCADDLENSLVHCLAVTGLTRRSYGQRLAGGFG